MSILHEELRDLVADEDPNEGEDPGEGDDREASDAQGKADAIVNTVEDADVMNESDAANDSEESDIVAAVNISEIESDISADEAMAIAQESGTRPVAGNNQTEQSKPANIGNLVPTIPLSDGNGIAQIGLGVLRVSDQETTSVVESAIEIGYRHIDGAAGYENEAGVGRALANTGFNEGKQRQLLWVTTKLRDSEQGYDSALKAFDRQLSLLQLDYVDMYMIHWPTPFDWRSAQTWKAFDKLREEGRVRTLGVCNFLPEHLERLHRETGEWPAVNQIELHPTWQQREVTEFCRSHNIAVEAYSPMARGADLQAGDGIIGLIAQEHGVSPAQVILRWHIENGTIIIPKSVHAERQRENLSLFGFELTSEEHTQIDELDGPTRSGHDPMTFSYA